MDFQYRLLQYLLLGRRYIPRLSVLMTGWSASSFPPSLSSIPFFSCVAKELWQDALPTLRPQSSCKEIGCGVTPCSVCGMIAGRLNQTISFCVASIPCFNSALLSYLQVLCPTTTQLLMLQQYYGACDYVSYDSDAERAR